MKRVFLSIILFLSITVAFCQIKTVTAKEAYILSNYNGSEFTKSKKIKAGSEIYVYKEFEKSNSFYEIEYKGIKGCIKEDCIAANEDILKLFQIKADRINAEATRKEKADSTHAEMAKRDKELLEEEEEIRYGKWYGYIKTKQVAIGMPAEFIEDAVGTPQQINRSQYSFGTRTQYVYKDMYVYTKNGVVDAIRRTKTN